MLPAILAAIPFVKAAAAVVGSVVAWEVFKGPVQDAGRELLNLNLSDAQAQNLGLLLNQDPVMLQRLVKSGQVSVEQLNQDAVRAAAGQPSQFGGKTEQYQDPTQAPLDMTGAGSQTGAVDPSVIDPSQLRGYELPSTGTSPYTGGYDSNTSADTGAVTEQLAAGRYGNITG